MTCGCIDQFHIIDSIQKINFQGINYIILIFTLTTRIHAEYGTYNIYGTLCKYKNKAVYSPTLYSH